MDPHDKGRDCERTEAVLDNYRARALRAEYFIAHLVTLPEDTPLGEAITLARRAIRERMAS